MSRYSLLPNEPSLFPGGMRGALCVTGTIGAAGETFNRRPDCEPIESAPFSEADIDPLLKLVSQCPTDALSTRVFQQHSSMGTCWHDAFIMILFHIDPLKPAIQEHARLLLRTLLEQGESDLAYGSETTTFSGKASAVAEVFRKTYPALPRSFWDMYVIALQRFLLLNYMFHKPEVLIEGIPEKTPPKALFLRRKSIGESQFSQLHGYFKESALKAPGAGLWCGQIGLLAPTIREFVSQNTGGEYSLFRMSQGDLTDFQAYYVWVGYIHVFSVFKCGGRWFVFDNDEGVGPFSEEDSNKLSTLQVTKGEFGDDPADPMKFLYTFTLMDGSTVSARADKSTDEPEKIGAGAYAEINFGSSFVIAKEMPVAAEASAAGGGGGAGGAANAPPAYEGVSPKAQAGGRRGSRRRATRRRKARKSTRRQRKTHARRS